LFAFLVERAHQRLCPCFPLAYLVADMQVALVNDGPVTFWLETP